MVIGILNFGEGLLWLNYLICCAIASLGALQIVAAQARLVGLMVFPVTVTRWLGIALVVGAYAWFFTVQPDLFIPGLAGGEFFALFILGFGIAVVVALTLGVLANQLRGRTGLPPLPGFEPLTLQGGYKAALWLPASSTAADGAKDLPPLVIALRESKSDALDILSWRLVTGGAAVLICNQIAAEAALEFVEHNAERFHPQHRYLMGVGRGADRALQLAGPAEKIRAVLALAPFGREENAHAGLRWLCETDYLTALGLTRQSGSIQPAHVPANALIVYGDEDLLIRPTVARELYPTAVMVAGARHFTLAAMPATLQLAADLFQVRAAARAAARRTHSVTSTARGELSE